ncbi:MAG: sulfurtransferase [Rhodobacterales bacterium]|nr:sulfurtransferase [Rhodobacterales bacterium]
MKTLVAGLCTAIFLAGSAASALALDVPRPLVDADWLDQHMDEVVVIDVRKDPSTFTKTGHIPGARVVKSGDLRTKRQVNGLTVDKMRPDQATFQANMRKLGINTDSAVVLTNRGEKASQVVHSTLLYWQLKYYGFDNVAILDGGNAAWDAALMDVSHDPAEAPEPGTFVAKAPREHLVATLPEVEETVEYGGPQLVDTRNLDYFLGLKTKSYVYAPGHIPKASVLPYPFMTVDDGPAVFRPVPELSAIAQYLGVDLHEPMIVYCNSGNLATANWFVAHELAGNMAARLYDGSMHQWTQEKGNPVARTIN